MSRTQEERRESVGGLFYRQYFCWSAKATKSLILARKKQNASFSGKKGVGIEAWKKISKEIGIPMNKCALKWKNLTSTYKALLKEKDPHESWRYFDLMDSILNKVKNRSKAPSELGSLFCDSAKLKQEPRVILDRLNEFSPKPLNPVGGDDDEVLEGGEELVYGKAAPPLDAKRECVEETLPFSESYGSEDGEESQDFDFDLDSQSVTEEVSSAPHPPSPPPPPPPPPAAPAQPLKASSKSSLSVSGISKRKRVGIKKCMSDFPFESLLYDTVHRVRRDLREQAKMRQKIMDLAHILLDNHRKKNVEDGVKVEDG